MINNNKPDLQAADSSGGNYSIDMAAKPLSKKENEGYLKFCKKHGLRVGWQQNRGGFSYRNREKES